MLPTKTVPDVGKPVALVSTRLVPDPPVPLVLSDKAPSKSVVAAEDIVPPHVLTPQP